MNRTNLTAIVKTCACGAEYTRAAWNALEAAGTAGDDVERLEQRHCTCGSTISLGTLLARVVYRIDAVPAGWLVWRKAGTRDEVAIGIGSKAIVFRKWHEVTDAIACRKRTDRGAATLLGVELVDDRGM